MELGIKRAHTGENEALQESALFLFIKHIHKLLRVLFNFIMTWQKGDV